MSIQEQIDQINRKVERLARDCDENLREIAGRKILSRLDALEEKLSYRSDEPEGWDDHNRITRLDEKLKEKESTIENLQQRVADLEHDFRVFKLVGRGLCNESDQTSGIGNLVPGDRVETPGGKATVVQVPGDKVYIYDGAHNGIPLENLDSWGWWRKLT
ncbi:MAG: hypothetical protein ABEK59_07610 [Halobacteria archaeon]